MYKIQSRDLYTILNGDHSEWPKGLDSNTRHWAYNALDSAVTLRVHSRLSETLHKSNTPHARTSYQFVRAMQGPALDMMLRGIAIQQKVRSDETERYLRIREAAQAALDQLADAVWGPEEYTVRTKRTVWEERVGKRGQEIKPTRKTVVDETKHFRSRGLNPNSNPQMLAFFNVALSLPVEYEIRKTPHGTERTPSANDKALKKWAAFRTKGPGINVRDHTVLPVKLAAPFVSLILTIRDADKMLSVLRSPLDADGRMRCSYNVVGTENGRWSSSKNAFGRGTNLQNVTPTMRRMFCADDGQRFISTDLEQAESRVVAGLIWQSTGDRTYWDACLSGDLHTTVARMTWPELEWSDDPKHNRKIADSPCPGFSRFSYRDVSKRLGHGSNYRGSSFGIAQAVGVSAQLVSDFQGRYFRAFPGIPLWHTWVINELRNHQYLDTPLGRRRWFFGRPTEDSTIREAIAFGPQSTVGELLNLVMLNCWYRSLLPASNPRHLPIQLLLQNHDAFAFQTPLSTDLPSIIAEVNSEFQSASIPLIRGDQHESLVIPGEFVTGFNWAYKENSPNQAEWKFKDGNPDGLTKWKGSDVRTRTQSQASTSADWLSRPVSRVY